MAQSSGIKIYSTAMHKSFSSMVNDFISSFDVLSDFDNIVVLPGFCDVHVHFREPGFSYKETIKSGSLAAAKGGYTDCMTMPNLNPVPDSLEALKCQLDIIKKDAKIGVYPLGSITKGQMGKELSDMADMAPYCLAFSDDGRGVQSDEMMLAAMQKAKELDRIIVAHCEDNSLLFGGYIHKGEYAKAHGHRGISSESEYRQIARDIELVKRVGCKYHVCHISTKESVEIIRQAKKDGVNITCETAPHYLVLTDSDLKEDGYFKMNPPLRSEADRQALIEGLLDGTIDMISTDHAPHSKEEKSRGLEKSAFGIVGIETAFPTLYTHLVKTGIIGMERLIELLCVNSRLRFGIPFNFDFSVWDLSKKYTLSEDMLISMGKATPFIGRELTGESLMTVRDGKIVYKNNIIK